MLYDHACIEDAYQRSILNVYRKRAYKFYSGNLIKAKKLKTINILIVKKRYKNFVISFTRYVHKKSTKMLHLNYHESIEKIEKHKRKKYLMVDYYMLDKVLDKIKEMINIEKLLRF